MKYQVEVTPSAQSDIETAYVYISHDSPENAARWRQGLYDIAKTLARFPDGCSYALENQVVDFEVRQKLYSNYRILFTIEDDRVIVLNVRHAAQPLKADELDQDSGEE